MDANEGNNGGFRRDKDDDHPDHHKDCSVDELGFKIDEERPNEVPQLVMPPEAITILQRLRDNQMYRSGYEFGQPSAFTNVWNQRKRTRSQNVENIGRLSHGTMSNRGNVLGQSTGQSRHVLPSDSLDQGTMSYHRNVLGQCQGTGGTRPWLHSEGSGQGTMSCHRNVLGRGQQGMHAQSVNPTATHYQHGNCPVFEEQQSASSGFFIPRGAHEHNMRNWSDPNRVNGNMLRQRGPSVPWGCHSHTHAHVQRGRNRECITQQPPFVNSGMFIPRAVHEHNMRVRPDLNMDCGNMFRQGIPKVQTGRHRDFFVTPMRPSFPNFGPQNVGSPVVAPSVNMPRSNMGMLPNANMAIEHRAAMGEASHREEDMSHRYRREHDREHDHEQGSLSGDAKRTKR